MAQPPHFDIEGSIYFVTTRLEERRNPLTDHEIKIVQSTILDMVIRKELMLYAYVIMLNHLHVLIKPLKNGISKTMQLLKGRASRQINTLKEAEASPTLHSSKRVILPGRGDFSRSTHVWQKGFFDFTIMTDKKFREKFNYIHYNPVKRGLVEKAEDYKYSSATRYKVKYGEVFYE
jgi:REP element-mobilizing transposase RayT